MSVKGRPITARHRDNIRAGVRRSMKPMTEAHKEAIRKARSIDWTPVLVRSVKELTVGGASIATTAEEIGVSVVTLHSAIKRGVFGDRLPVLISVRRKANWTEERKSAVRRIAEAGGTLREQAEAVGYVHSTVAAAWKAGVFS